MRRSGLPAIVATFALSLSFAPSAHANSLCAALADMFPHCREGRPIASTETLPVYRMNTAAFAGELCMWTRHGPVCAHETACSPAEYAKGRCL